MNWKLIPEILMFEVPLKALWCKHVYVYDGEFEGEAYYICEKCGHLESHKINSNIIES